MPVGTPGAAIGAQFPLGFATQSTLGTPVTVPATAGNWINQTANTLEYVTGAHMIKTALGTRADEQESALGEIHLQGGFEANLRTSTIRTLIEAVLGTGTTAGTPAVDTITVSKPKLLTIVDNWGGETHSYQDCMLAQATVSCQSHAEWKVAFTVLGGLETLVASPTPTFSSSDPTLAWADVQSISGLSAVGGQISQFSFTINNTPKQDFGAGQHAATSVIGGEFIITGSFMVRYDDANAATVAADFKSGTDLGPSVLTIGPTGNQHAITFPNITLLSATPQKPLDDYIRLNVGFGVKSAQNFQWVMPG